VLKFQNSHKFDLRARIAAAATVAEKSALSRNPHYAGRRVSIMTDAQALARDSATGGRIDQARGQEQ
jgi:hypothetical protein